MKNLKAMKIISEGQTGADRAGLDWAMKHGIPHGGWCPKGRNAEDGPILDLDHIHDAAVIGHRRLVARF